MKKKLEMLLNIKTLGVSGLKESGNNLKINAKNAKELVETTKTLTETQSRLERSLKGQNKELTTNKRKLSDIAKSRYGVDSVRESIESTRGKTEELNKELKKTNDNISKIGKNKGLDSVSDKSENINQKFKGITKSTIGVFAALSAFAVGTVLYGMSRLSSELSDLKATADKTGVSFEMLQGYKVKLSQMGVSVESFAASVAKLNRTTTAASNYGVNNYAKMYADLGIEFKKFSDMKPDEQFKTLAEAVREFDDNQSRAILNRLGLTDLELPIQQFNDLNREFEIMSKNGLIMSSELASDISYFNDEVEHLQKEFQAFSRLIYAEMIPNLKELFNLGRDTENEVLNGDNAKSYASFLSTIIGLLKTIFDLLVAVVKTAGSAIVMIIGGLISLIEKISRVLIFSLDAVTNSLKLMSDKVQNMFINMYYGIINTLNNLKSKAYNIIGKDFEYDLKVNIKPTKDSVKIFNKDLLKNSMLGSDIFDVGVGLNRSGIDQFKKDMEINFKAIAASSGITHRDIEDDFNSMADSAKRNSKKIQRDYEVSLDSLKQKLEDIKNQAIIDGDSLDTEKLKLDIENVYNEMSTLAKESGRSNSEILKIESLKVQELKNLNKERDNELSKIQQVNKEIERNKKIVELGLGENYGVNIEKIKNQYDQAINEALSEKRLDDYISLFASKNQYLKNLVESENKSIEESKRNLMNSANESILNIRSLEKLGEIDREKAANKILNVYKELLDKQKQMNLGNRELNETLVKIAETEESIRSSSISNEYKSITNSIRKVQLLEQSNQISKIEASKRLISLNDELMRSQNKNGEDEIKVLETKVEIKKQEKIIEEELRKEQDKINEELKKQQEIEKQRIEDRKNALDQIYSAENEILDLTNKRDEVLKRERDYNIEKIKNTIKEKDLMEELIKLEETIYDLNIKQNRLDSVNENISKIESEILATSIFNTEKLNSLQTELLELTQEKLNLEDELNIKREEALELDLFNVEEMKQFFEVFYDSAFDAFGSWVDGSKNAKEAFKDFAMSTLKHLLKMIQQFIVLKAIQSSMGFFGNVGGTIGMGFSSQGIPRNHNGGLVGDYHNHSAMKGAMSFTGLKDNEALRVLEKGEFVATKKQQENISNAIKGGNNQSSDQNIINNVLIDNDSLASTLIKTKHFSSGIGEYIKNNKKSIKSELDSV